MVLNSVSVFCSGFMGVNIFHLVKHTRTRSLFTAVVHHLSRSMFSAKDLSGSGARSLFIRQQECKSHFYKHWCC